MGKLIYSMNASLDGYMKDRHGNFNWLAPDEEAHLAHNATLATLSGEILGRRMWEIMKVWDAPEPVGDAPVLSDFQTVWQALPKTVFSRTLTETGVPAATIADADLATVVARETAKGDVGIGGAELAGQALAQGLVDEIHAFVMPVVVGGGTPFLPQLDQPIGLETIDRRDFASGTTQITYRVLR